jgi:hypothetical protein
MDEIGSKGAKTLVGKAPTAKFIAQEFFSQRGLNRKNPV